GGIMHIQRALITGASSGIGEEFARQLARRGSHLILVARRGERLRELAEEFKNTFRVNAEVLVADLSTPEGIEAVTRTIRNTGDLDLLVNNAGFGVPGDFHDNDFILEQRMVRVHVEAVNELSRAAVEGMVTRGHGAIINVASLTGFGPTPGSVNYSATKAYIIRFSQGLAIEVKQFGVKVQALCPGFTHTGFHYTPELIDAFNKGVFPWWMWTRVEKVVFRSLRGLDLGRVVVIPGWGNWILSCIMSSRLYARLMYTLAGKIWTPKKQPDEPGVEPQ
ncbi:MAG: SDR family oxidoreductase, partial [bacterium]